MRRTSIITATLVATAGLAIAPAIAAVANSKHETPFGCALELVAQGPPQGTPPSGIHLGVASCPSPFGEGRHHNAYTVTPTGDGRRSIAANFTNYYARGTTSGTASLTFDPTTSPNITYTGTVTYTGGSRKFKHVRGSGTIRCTTSDGGAHKSCAVNSILTGF